MKRVAAKKNRTFTTQEKIISDVLAVGLIGVSIYLLWLIWQMRGIESGNDTAALLGWIGAFIYRTMDSLLGSGKLLLPILLLALSFSLLSSKITVTRGQAVGFLMVALCLLAFLHLKTSLNEHTIQLG